MTKNAKRQAIDGAILAGAAGTRKRRTKVTTPKLEVVKPSAIVDGKEVMREFLTSQTANEIKYACNTGSVPREAGSYGTNYKTQLSNAKWCRLTALEEHAGVHMKDRKSVIKALDARAEVLDEIQARTAAETALLDGKAGDVVKRLAALADLPAPPGEEYLDRLVARETAGKGRKSVLKMLAGLVVPPAPPAAPAAADAGPKAPTGEEVDATAAALVALIKNEGHDQEQILAAAVNLAGMLEAYRAALPPARKRRAAGTPTPKREGEVAAHTLAAGQWYMDRAGRLCCHCYSTASWSQYVGQDADGAGYYWNDRQVNSPVVPCDAPANADHKAMIAALLTPKNRSKCRLELESAWAV